MKLKYDEADMHAQLVKVLYPDETAMFPVYCVYNDKSFMGSAMEYGYLAVTDKGRLLMIRYDFIGDGNCGSCPLTAIKRLKIKKLLIGQYKLEFTLMTDGKDFKTTVQIAPKMAFGAFPHQYANFNMLLDALRPYAEN